MLKDFMNIPLFEGFNSNQLELLKSLFEAYSCPANTVIFEQGGQANYLYLILQGTIEIQFKPYDGPPLTLTHLKEGDVFGWSAVIGSPAYTSGTKSNGSVEAIRIRGTDLKRLCKEHPSTGATILDRLARVVSTRWRNASLQVKCMLREGMSDSQTSLTIRS